MRDTTAKLIDKINLQFMISAKMLAGLNKLVDIKFLSPNKTIEIEVDRQ